MGEVRRRRPHDAQRLELYGARVWSTRGAGLLARVAGRQLPLFAVLGGFGTWLMSPPHTITIGASGLVFGYAAYLVARGLFNRRISQVLIGVVVVLVWGSALLGGLLPQDGISWQGHLCGAIAGLLAAWVLTDDRKQQPRPVKR